ncbi:unnamed protein product [Heligmosomoides polygyrus]|uniref:RabBD domain-containing protein n=1 Tax=Heligmosomoides polygyrus TaxID=6339 RepID=A0A3P8A0G3_HELPZ|nr:unnamed protein product [Heligmosomoides polygyrus]
MSIEETEELFELLKGLSPREQAIIRPVLERDLEFQRREKARLRQLKSYVEMSELQHRLPSVGRKAINCPLMQSISSDSMISIGSFRSNRPTIARPCVLPLSLPARPGLQRWHKVRSVWTSSVQQLPTGNVSLQVALPDVPHSSAATTTAFRPCVLPLSLPARPGLQRWHKVRSVWTSSVQQLPTGNVSLQVALPDVPHSSWGPPRELRAASGEWVDGGDPAEVSELLLAQMRRAAMEKEKQEEQKNSVVHVRAPMMSRRHLTLPTIATPSLLAVPSEPDLKAINKEAAQERFWGGSPTPRAPRKDEDSLSSVRITAPTPSPSRNLQSGFHQREVIGSPVPRPDSSSPMSITPVNGDASSLPTTEVTSPTPTSRTQLPSPMSPRSPTSMIPKRYGAYGRQLSELSMPTFHLTSY